MTVLGTVHKLVFDKSSEVFQKHPDTTSDVMDYCQDIKVSIPLILLMYVILLHVLLYLVYRCVLLSYYYYYYCYV